MDLLPTEAGLLRVEPTDHGLRLIGEVDLANVCALREALTAVVDTSDSDVWLDLSALSFIDVGGVTALLLCADSLPAGRTMILTDPPRVFQRILAVCWGGDPGPGVRVVGR